jgi:hypothetical protein
MIKKKALVFSILTFFLVMGNVFGGDKAGISEKEFPIIMYAVHINDESMSKLKKMGVNYVHSYSTGKDDARSIEKARKLLVLAEKHGLKVMFYLKGRYWAKKENGATSLKKIVELFKDSPALGMWMLADEPRPKTKEKIIHFNEIVRKYGNNKPTTLVIHWIKDWWRYGKGNTCDFLMQDSYPVGDKPFPDAPLNLLTKYISAGVKLDHPVIPVLQTFNFKVFPRELKKRKYNANKCRYPNIQEMRFMIFAPMCMGVRGMAFYSFARACQLDKKGVWQRNVLAPAISELKRFTDSVTPAQKPTKVIASPDKKYYAALWLRKSGRWMVIVNNTKSVQNVAVELPGKLKVDSIEKWGNTDKALNISIKNNKIKAVLKPWDTAILKLNN